MIKAIVLIKSDAASTQEAAQTIADFEGVQEVYSCAGDVDLIALVQVDRHEDLAALVPGRIGKVAGVRNTDTHIAFRSYSHAAVDAAFDIGAE